MPPKKKLKLNRLTNEECRILGPIISRVIAVLMKEKKVNDACIKRVISAITQQEIRTSSNVLQRYRNGEPVLIPNTQFNPAPKADAIADIARNNFPITKCNIMYKVEQELGDSTDISHVNKTLKKIKFNTKLSSKTMGISDPETEAKRAKALNTLIDTFYDFVLKHRAKGREYKFCFLDETTFDFTNMYSKIRWCAPSGVCVQVQPRANLAKLNTKINCTVFLTEENLEFIEFSEETNTANRFITGVRHFLENVGDDFYIFIVDNARIHRRVDFEELKKTYPNIHVVFLPPYSPDTNAAEYAIKKLKDDFRKMMPDYIEEEEMPMVDYAHCFFERYVLDAGVAEKMCKHALHLLELMYNNPYGVAITMADSSKYS